MCSLPRKKKNCLFFLKIIHCKTKNNHLSPAKKWFTLTFLCNSNPLSVTLCNNHTINHAFRKKTKMNMKKYMNSKKKWTKKQKNWTIFQTECRWISFFFFLLNTIIEISRKPKKKQQQQQQQTHFLLNCFYWVFFLKTFIYPPKIPRIQLSCTIPT